MQVRAQSVALLHAAPVANRAYPAETTWLGCLAPPVSFGRRTAGSRLPDRPDRPPAPAPGKARIPRPRTEPTVAFAYASPPALVLPRAVEEGAGRSRDAVEWEASTSGAFGE